MHLAPSAQVGDGNQLLLSCREWEQLLHPAMGSLPRTSLFLQPGDSAWSSALGACHVYCHICTTNSLLALQSSSSPHNPSRGHGTGPGTAPVCHNAPPWQPPWPAAGSQAVGAGQAGTGPLGTEEVGRDSLGLVKVKWTSLRLGKVGQGCPKLGNVIWGCPEQESPAAAFLSW